MEIKAAREQVPESSAKWQVTGAIGMESARTPVSVVQVIRKTLVNGAAGPGTKYIFVLGAWSSRTIDKRLRLNEGNLHQRLLTDG